jgi:glutaredoxin
MAYTVNIFTLDGCSHCKTLKEEFKKQGIPYTEFEVNKFRTIYDSILELSLIHI